MNTMEDTTLWLGNMSSYLALTDTLARIDNLSEEARASYYGIDDDDEDNFEGYGYMVHRAGSVAVVNVKGSLTNRESWINRYFGITSYGEIRNAISAAVNDPNIDSVLLDVASPGGAAQMVAELSTFIDMVDRKYKPVYSHTSDEMASAAYWIGSAARKVSATDMSSVGSIGVIAIHKEYTAMLEDAGIKATVFREGKFKALGSPYEKLSQEASDHIQETLSDLYGFFTDAVAENRGLTSKHVREKAAEGQVFWGPEAKEVGLVDKIMTLEEVVNQLDRAHNSKQDELYTPQPQGAQAMKGKNVVITAEAREAIAVGMPEDEALKKFGAEAAAEETTTPAADAGAEEEHTETAAEETVKADADADGSEGAEDSADAPAAAADNSAVTVLSKQVADLQSQLIDAKTDLKAAEADREKMQAASVGLIEIAKAYAARMQIAMGATPQDLSHLDAASLVEQHASIMRAFNERYPVDGKSAVTTERPDGELAAEQDQPAAARSKVTRFRPAS